MKFSLQTILLIVFGAFTLFGVAVFAGYIKIGSSSKSNTPVGTAIMWGTMSTQTFNILRGNFSKDAPVLVQYVQKNPATYENDLVAALASGKGPDLFMITPEILWRQKDKMYPIPYVNLPLRTYQDTYMDIAGAYVTSEGYLGIPLFVDPLVGYWNKDLFASVGLAVPPKEWKEFPDLAKKLSIVSNDFTIEQSAVALGEFGNIRHGKETLSLLFMQSGDPITRIDAEGKIQPVLGAAKADGVKSSSAASVALSFYTQFANPSSKDTYSWNKIFTSDRDQFLSGDLAYYFGLGSELGSLHTANPNLNFDMAITPQKDKTGSQLTYGYLYGVAISKASKNIPYAYYALSDLTSIAKSGGLLDALAKTGFTVAPARRDLTPLTGSNTYTSLMYQSSLVSRMWIDPNANFTSQLFADMIGDVLSGKSGASAAVSDASKKFSAYLKQTEPK